MVGDPDPDNAIPDGGPRPPPHDHSTALPLSAEVLAQGAAPSADLLRRLVEHGAKQSRYRLEGEVARGGMGAILRVWDEDLRRPLAMKVILGKGSEPSGETPPAEARQVARFLEEAQVTGQLDHPGIVPVHELGIDAGGRLFFTMRLVKGRDLKEIYGLTFKEQEGWNETRTLGVLLKVCEALSYAHAKGVIHRDLKPANVMVGRFGEVYVMDWGLARVVNRAETHDLRLQPTDRPTTHPVATERRTEREETPDSPLITMDGDVVGTPVYMAPEQARGEIESLSARSDVYAVGAMLYHLLARQMPFVPPGAGISNRSVLVRVIEGPPRLLRELRRDLPAELEAICEQAMAREPTGRYRDMRELGDDLRSYLEGRIVSAYATGSWARARKWVGRNRSLAASLFAALVLGTAVVAFATYSVTQRAYIGRMKENAVRALDQAEFRSYLRALPDREAVEVPLGKYRMRVLDLGGSILHETEFAVIMDYRGPKRRFEVIRENVLPDGTIDSQLLFSAPFGVRITLKQDEHGFRPVYSNPLEECREGLILDVAFLRGMLSPAHNAVAKLFILDPGEEPVTKNGHTPSTPAREFEATTELLTFKEAPPDRGNMKWPYSSPTLALWRRVLLDGELSEDTVPIPLWDSVHSNDEGASIQSRFVMHFVE